MISKDPRKVRLRGSVVELFSIIPLVGEGN